MTRPGVDHLFAELHAQCKDLVSVAVMFCGKRTIRQPVVILHDDSDDFVCYK